METRRESIKKNAVAVEECERVRRKKGEIREGDKGRTQIK